MQPDGPVFVDCAVSMTDVWSLFNCGRRNSNRLETKRNCSREESQTTNHLFRDRKDVRPGADGNHLEAIPKAFDLLDGLYDVFFSDGVGRPAPPLAQPHQQF